jgi:hypothetical protein
MHQNFIFNFLITYKPKALLVITMTGIWFKHKLKAVAHRKFFQCLEPV